MPNPLATARSLLFVPATRSDRMVRALQSGADLVVCDLEDAVPPDQKDAARAHLAQRLHALASPDRARCVVRINAAETTWHSADLKALAPLLDAGLGGVMVPKSEQVGALAMVAQALGPQAALIALVESLAGWDALDRLATADQVHRLAFGHLDFQLDLGMRCEPGERELDAVRFAFVAASRRAGLPAPIDGVTTATT
ncbi:MAG: CoA ester lyase, partial [Rhodoferax sp.]|nr:CoA ester lyase [Rhodoferax sp.]